MDLRVFKNRVVKLGWSQPSGDEAGTMGSSRVYSRIKFSGSRANALEELQEKAASLLAVTSPATLHVYFTYIDHDGDRIILLSNQDLLDAMEAEPNLRILMECKPSEPDPEEPAANNEPTEGALSHESPPRAFVEMAEAESPTQGTSPTVNRAPSATTEDKDVPPHAQAVMHQLQTVVDGLVDVVSTATIALSNQVHDHMIKKKQFRQNSRSRRHFESTPGCENNIQQHDPETVAAAVPPAVETSADDTRDKIPDTTETPFVHGRHTCDGCLTTPIVGLRYHATNLQDYDLCAACWDNYKGHEIQFEVAVSPCDQVHQERWRHRLDRASHGPWNLRRRPSIRHLRSCPRHGHGFASQQQQQPEEFDLALAEAIRRSLRDENKTTNDEPTRRQDIKEAPKETPSTETVDLPSSDAETPFEMEAKHEDQDLLMFTETVQDPPLEPTHEEAKPPARTMPNLDEWRAKQMREHLAFIRGLGPPFEIGAKHEHQDLMLLPETVQYQPLKPTQENVKPPAWAMPNLDYERVRNLENAQAWLRVKHNLKKIHKETPSTETVAPPSSDAETPFEMEAKHEDQDLLVFTETAQNSPLEPTQEDLKSAWLEELRKQLPPPKQPLPLNKLFVLDSKNQMQSLDKIFVEDLKKHGWVREPTSRQDSKESPKETPSTEMIAIPPSDAETPPEMEAKHEGQSLLWFMETAKDQPLERKLEETTKQLQPLDNRFLEDLKKQLQHLDNRLLEDLTKQLQPLDDRFFEDLTKNRWVLEPTRHQDSKEAPKETPSTETIAPPSPDAETSCKMEAKHEDQDLLLLPEEVRDRPLEQTQEAVEPPARAKPNLASDRAEEMKKQLNWLREQFMIPSSDTPRGLVVPSAPSEYEVLAHEESFAEDAAGNGEAAAVLGTTLDLFARAIDDVNTELGRLGTMEPDIIVPSGNGMNEDDAMEICSHASWSVVDDEEQLARATQALGSALFSSDIENVSAMTHEVSQSNSKVLTSSSCSKASTVTSVPTEVPTLISADRTGEAPTCTVSAAQWERWAIQLDRLHELGIMNDELSVEILEYLNAANIGVDSTDEVTVEQVVNELMKD